MLRYSIPRKPESLIRLFVAISSQNLSSRALMDRCVSYVVGRWSPVSPYHSKPGIEKELLALNARAFCLIDSSARIWAILSLIDTAQRGKTYQVEDC